MASIINADVTNGVVITSDTSGEINLQANGVTKAKVTANGLQDVNGNSYGLSKTSGMYRSLILNGDMSIAQRGTSATGITSAGYYTVDRFSLPNINIGTWTQSQDTDVPSGQGFVKSLKMQCTSSASLSAGSILEIHQLFEGQNVQHIKKGTANAESLTLSFWVKTNKTGTYTTSLIDNDNVRHIGATYTVSSADTWEKKTITFSGDTSGALDNDNNVSFRVLFHLAVGSDWTSGTADTAWNASIAANRAVGQTVNLADSTSNYINITGVQLEVGSSASDFEFLPYDVQLARCERYFQKNYLMEDAPGVATSGENTRYMHGSSDASNNAAAGVFWRCRMRATPTVTWYTDGGTQGQWNYARSGASGTGSFISYRVGDTGANGYIGVGVAWASCSVYGNWTANAEL